MQLRSPKPSLFYRSAQIRFRHLGSDLPLRPQKTRVLLASNPWTSLKAAEVEELVARLEDSPRELEAAIRERVKPRRKFQAVVDDFGSMERKKKGLEAQFRSLLKHRKSSRVMLLPRLGDIRYVYKDNLHEVAPAG
jgi:hypothetical protein